MELAFDELPAELSQLEQGALVFQLGLEVADDRTKLPLGTSVPVPLAVSPSGCGKNCDVQPHTKGGALSGEDLKEVLDFCGGIVTTESEVSNEH